jgi:hypothetical protein
MEHSLGNFKREYVQLESQSRMIKTTQEVNVYSETEIRKLESDVQ